MTYFLLFLALIGAMLLVGALLDKDFWRPLPYPYCPIHYDQLLTERGWCSLCHRIWKV